MGQIGRKMADGRLLFQALYEYITAGGSSPKCVPTFRSVLSPCSCKMPLHQSTPALYIMHGVNAGIVHHARFPILNNTTLVLLWYYHN